MGATNGRLRTADGTALITLAGPGTCSLGERARQIWSMSRPRTEA
jgi:hypothetical protein